MFKVSKKVASVAVVLKGRVNAVGAYPVKIRVTFNRQSKVYPVNIDGKSLYLKATEWKDLNEVKVRKARKHLKEGIEKIKSAAVTARDTITQNGRAFSFDKFDQEFLTQESAKGVLSLFRDYMQELRNNNQIGTYKVHNNAFQAFFKFRGGKELLPADLTTAMLKKFETYLESSDLKKKKRSAGRTTIGIYLRCLRVIYNIAITKNRSLAELYPFAKGQADKSKYKIKTGSGTKGEAMSLEQLKKFISLEVSSDATEYEAKLLWLFSFHAQGMNFRDLSLLKYENIKGEVISYVRQKTRNTEAAESKMELPLSDPLREIIVTIGNPDKRSKAYVFNIIEKGMRFGHYKRRVEREKTAEERVDEVIRQRLKMTNVNLKRLCKANGLPQITTYWARHTYASLLKESGESVEMIRELLGHSDIKTTESYLKRFDIGRKRMVNDRLNSVLKAS